MPRRQQVRIGGRSLTVSNLDKVLYPDTGTTKAEVLRYYLDVADVMLPHLARRPVTLRRYPDGVGAEGFFQKQCPDHRPEWLRTMHLNRGRADEDEYCDLGEVAALAWAANLGALELHVPMGRAPDPSVPTAVVFDLDPGAPAGILECARLALRIRDALDHLDLSAVPKTSGGKGLQLYVPVNRPDASYEQTRGFAHSLARTLERLHPGQVVTTQNKVVRAGKVLIDWYQNHLTKTTVCAYSLRGRDRPTVSTPLEWREVEAAVGAEDASALRFELDEVVARVERRGDLFAPVAHESQALPRLRG